MSINSGFFLKTLDSLFTIESTFKRTISLYLPIYIYKRTLPLFSLYQCVYIYIERERERE